MRGRWGRKDDREGGGDARCRSGAKTNENERATEPTDNVASRGTEVYTSPGPFYLGALGATSIALHTFFPTFLQHNFHTPY